MSDKSGHAAEVRPAGTKLEAGPRHRLDRDLQKGIDDVIDFDNVETIQSARTLLSIALLTSRIHELHHRLDEIDLAVQRVRTALVALSTMRAVVDDAKAILRTGAAFSDAASYPALAVTFNEFYNHLDLLVEESTLDEINLLKGADYTVKFNDDGSRHFIVKGANLTADGLGISRLSEENADEADFVAKIKELVGAAQKLGATSTLLEGALTVINSRRTFTRKIVKTLDQTARQITEDKTGRSSFYQTVSGLLGASARRHLAAAIDRLSPDKDETRNRKALADQIPDPANNEDSNDYPEDEPGAKSAARAALESTESTTEAEGPVATREPSAPDALAAGDPATQMTDPPEPADTPIPSANSLISKVIADCGVFADFPVGPVDMALASLNQMYAEPGEKISEPAENEGVGATKNGEIEGTPRSDGRTGEPDEWTDGTSEKKTGGIRMILNRLRRNEQETPIEEGSSGTVMEAPGRTPNDRMAGPDPSCAFGASRSHGEKEQRNNEEKGAQAEIIKERRTPEQTSETLDQLSARMLKILDLNAYAEARLTFGAGDSMIFARCLGVLASERGDDIHDIFSANEAFRNDVRQFKLSFLHLIKADIEENQAGKPDTLIGKWLKSDYGEIYKVLYRNCPPEDKN